MAAKQKAQTTTAILSTITPAPVAAVPGAPREQIRQTTFPSYSLEKSLLIARAIADNFSGRSGNPNQIAIGINWTPTGGAWRALAGASIAYGLTEGGYGASEIRLTPRGSAIVMPIEESGEKQHLRDAILEPTLMRAFIERYKDAKFPSKEIGANVLSTFGYPRDRCAEAFDIIEQNLKYVGALVPTKTGHMVLLGAIGAPLAATGASPGLVPDRLTPRILKQDVTPATPPAAPPTPPITAVPEIKNYNVFISHGKNRELVDTLKRLVSYGKFNPIVSVEISDTSKPVPQKVMEEMRSCFGGIVHVRSEGDWTDADGNAKTKINDNVLIEIGAAMAMYKDNFILLAERGIQLPSNLQGLFVCHYDGDRMDADATMSLLEGLNRFIP